MEAYLGGVWGDYPSAEYAFSKCADQKERFGAMFWNKILSIFIRIFFGFQKKNIMSNRIEGV